MSAGTQSSPLGQLSYEANGINVISEDERKGSPRDLFWPWFAANISVLGLSYGAYVLGFGISFWQACVAGLIGIVVSFLLVGFIAVAGKRGSAPTLVLSRAAFGVQGNKLPALVSWILNVGWEIVLTVLATLATATVFHRLGWSAGDLTKVIAFIVITALIVGSAALGFDTIMRLQAIITVVTGILTVVYFILVADKIHWATVSGLHSGSFAGRHRGDRAGRDRLRPRLGETRRGLLPVPAALLLRAPAWCGGRRSARRSRRCSCSGSGCCSPGSSTSLSSAISADPIGALSTLLPTWYLVPFVLVAVLGLVGGAVLDIYSSGLTMLAAGVRDPAVVGGADRRRADGDRHDLRGVLLVQLHRAVRRVPDHARRGDRGVVRRDAGGHPAAAVPVRGGGPVHVVRPVRRGPLGAGGT